MVVLGTTIHEFACRRALRSTKLVEAEASPSKRRERPLQELRFFFRRLAPQRFVAMREAAEALDDIPVVVAVFQVFRRNLAELAHAALEQGDEAVLVGERLAMFKRQVEE